MKTTYDKIEDVIRTAGRALAAHEFYQVTMGWTSPSQNEPNGGCIDGRRHVGQSESTIARRMREMVQLGRLKAQTREGRNFKEYALTTQAEKLQQHGLVAVPA